MNSTAMNLTKFEDKYGVMSESEENTAKQIAVIKHWRDSEHVVMLSAFLKEHNDQGFILQQTKEGKAVLSFEPGLKAQDQDPERWDLALYVYDLMDKAREDLNKLIFNGHLTLPQYTGIWL